MPQDYNKKTYIIIIFNIITATATFKKQKTKELQHLNKVVVSHKKFVLDGSFLRKFPFLLSLENNE